MKQLKTDNETLKKRVKQLDEHNTDWANRYKSLKMAANEDQFEHLSVRNEVPDLQC